MKQGDKGGLVVALPWWLLAIAGLYWLARIYLTGLWPNYPIDFSLFYGAGMRVLSGEAGLVYDGAAHDALLGLIHGVEPPDGLLFAYPPPGLLFVWPLALMPFVAAWAVFLLPGMAAFFWIARRLAGTPVAIGMTFAIGGPIHSLQLGQSGFYSASLLAGGLLALRHNKLAAGIALGLLAIKPHLAVIAFLALLWWREWKAFGIAVATFAALSALSVAVFGVQIWFDSLGGSTSFVDTVTAKQQSLVETMQQSVLALSIRHTGVGAAFVIQAISAVLAVAAAAIVRDRNLAIAAVIAATLLFTPFSFLYDSTMLFLAAAILLRERSFLSLPLALVLGLTGLWFFVLGSLVPIAAVVVLGMAITLDRFGGLSGAKAVPADC